MNAPSPFETELTRLTIQQEYLKTAYDKVLAKDEVKRVQELHKKAHLTREELQELLNHLVAVESKLLNYDESDRYALSLFFTRVRSYVEIRLMLYDIEETIQKYDQEKNKLTDNAKKLFITATYKSERALKYVMDIYFALSRSSLSINAEGFKTITKSQDMPYIAQQQQQEQKKLFGLI
jgi:hypothetical protein